MDELDDTFLVISGDVLTDIDLTALIAEHREREALATIGLVRVENPLEYGIVISNEDGSIERFLEKPTWGQVFSDTINSGVYVLEPRIFDWIAPDQPVDFSSDVFPALLEAGRAASSARSARATGRTSARCRPTCGPTRTSSTARSSCRIPGLRARRRRVRGRGRRDQPRCRT